MGLAYVIVGVLSAAIAVFALQNNQPMSLRFITWSIENVPLAGAVLASLAVGLILSAVPLSIANWRLRSRIRTLEAKVSMLESALTVREPAHLAPRAPAPAPPVPRTSADAA
jgi:uncharacterized integral membrane protein